MQFLATTISFLLALSVIALPSDPHSTFCGIRGYDRFNNPYDIQQDSFIRTLSQCRSSCLRSARCKSYALGKGACILYDYDTLGSFVAYEGSYYVFYDRSCGRPSISVSKTLSTIAPSLGPDATTAMEPSYSFGPSCILVFPSAPTTSAISETNFPVESTDELESMDYPLPTRSKSTEIITSTVLVSKTSLLPTSPESASISLPIGPGSSPTSLPTGPGSASISLPTGPGSVSISLPTGPGSASVSLPTGPGSLPTSLPTGPGSAAVSISLPTGPGSATVSISLPTGPGSASVSLPTGPGSAPTSLPTGPGSATVSISLPTGPGSATVSISLPTGPGSATVSISLPTGPGSASVSLPTGPGPATVSLPTGPGSASVSLPTGPGPATVFLPTGPGSTDVSLPNSLGPTSFQSTNTLPPTGPEPKNSQSTARPTAEPTDEPTPEPSPALSLFCSDDIPSLNCPVLGSTRGLGCGSGVNTTTSGHIQILDRCSNSVLGYINNDATREYNFVLTSSLDDALIVTANYQSADCSAPSGISLALQNSVPVPNSVGAGFLGGMGDAKMGSGKYSYIYLGPAGYVAPNSPPTIVPTVFGNSPAESSYWNLDLSCGLLTSTWTNEDTSQVSTEFFLNYSGCPEGCLFQSGDAATFHARTTHNTIQVVTLRFVPLA